jgi:alkylhydroperoxidase family enzyme
LQEAEESVVEVVSRGTLESPPLTAKERALLELVTVLTHHAWKTGDGDVEKVRAAGWTDPEIAEAVYITALFAFFNRVADAFGLKDPKYRELALQNRQPPLESSRREG